MNPITLTLFITFVLSAALFWGAHASNQTLGGAFESLPPFRVIEVERVEDYQPHLLYPSALPVCSVHMVCASQRYQ